MPQKAKGTAQAKCAVEGKMCGTSQQLRKGGEKSGASYHRRYGKKQTAMGKLNGTVLAKRYGTTSLKGTVKGTGSGAF